MSPAAVSPERMTARSVASLPPTPPAVPKAMSREEMRNVANRAETISSQASTSSLNGVNSPITITASPRATTPRQKNLPTPDLTPPHVISSVPQTQHRLRIERAPPSMSSRAESFQTAREELSSVDGDYDEEDHDPVIGASKQRWLDAVKPLQWADSGLGTDLEEEERSNARTPTRRFSGRKPVDTSTDETSDDSVAPIPTINLPSRTSSEKSITIPDSGVTAKKSYVRIRPTSVEANIGADKTAEDIQPSSRSSSSTEGSGNVTKRRSGAISREQLPPKRNSLVQQHVQRIERRLTEPETPPELIHANGTWKPFEQPPEAPTPPEPEKKAAPQSQPQERPISALKIRKTRRSSAQPSENHAAPRSPVSKDERPPSARLLAERPLSSLRVHRLSEDFTQQPDSAWKGSGLEEWRHSVVSQVSDTVAAMVIEVNPGPIRTLRHVSKTTSLRSVSLPASQPPTRSNRNSLGSATGSGLDSPHRLVRRAVKISNQNRWSVGSDDISVASATSKASPSQVHEDRPQPPEQIKVVVIPDRISSLKSSGSGSATSGSASQVSSLSTVSSTIHRPLTSEGLFEKQPVSILRRRPRTESDPLRRKVGQNDLGTAPDLRTSAKKSRFDEVDRSPGLYALEKTKELSPVPISPVPAATKERVEPVRSLRPAPQIVVQKSPDLGNHWDHSEDGDLDHLSFRQHSFDHSSARMTPSSQRSSPGPVEINEARMVSMFPTDKNSLQLVNHAPQPSNRATMINAGDESSLEQETSLELTRPAAFEQAPHTPPMNGMPTFNITDSPLRNPRAAPKPPQFKITPPTPANELDRQLGLPLDLYDRDAGKSKLRRGIGSVKRAISQHGRRYSETVIPNLLAGRSLSQSKPTTKRHLDGSDDEEEAVNERGKLHPFWRPRGFWDDISDSDSDCDSERSWSESGSDCDSDSDDEGHGRRDRSQRFNRTDDMVVSNSLGMPQKRGVVFNGPLNIVRRISNSGKKYYRGAGQGSSIGPNGTAASNVRSKYEYNPHRHRINRVWGPGPSASFRMANGSISSIQRQRNQTSSPVPAAGFNLRRHSKWLGSTSMGMREAMGIRVPRPLKSARQKFVERRQRRDLERRERRREEIKKKIGARIVDGNAGNAGNAF